MSDTNDGGPAFPVAISHNRVGELAGDPQIGMTLRDYFAAQALQGWVAGESGSDLLDPVEAAQNCYAYADAMLKAREQ